MKADRGRLVMLGFLVAASMACAAPARADVTLQAQIVGATCSVTTVDGTTTLPCSPGSWSVMLQPGWSAQMVATIDYTYADSGWVLDRPQAFQMDTAGFNMRFFDHEAGALYAMTSNCISRYCVHPPGQDYTGWSSFPPVFLSANDAPDTLSGSVTVSTGAALSAGVPFTWTPNIYIALRTQTFSGLEPVAAVPEPATYLLMASGLMLVVGLKRRVRVPSR